MGRTTFDSMMGYYERSGRPIPKRIHIIVTRDPRFTVSHADCFVASSIDEALEKAKECEKDEVFISGGASIFKQTIDKADRLYLTVVHGEFEGDTYFPDYSAFCKVLAKEDRSSGDTHYTFLDLSR
jgi:dihydrofolate reductase